LAAQAILVPHLSHCCIAFVSLRTMAVRLEKTTGGSNKFWTICIEDETQTEVSYGAIGAKPRTSHKDHSSAAEAEKFKAKLIASKKKEGYVEAKSGGDPVKEPASKKAKVESTSKTTRLECTDGGSNKFWEILVDGTKTVVSYGAIGASPKKSEKDFPSADAAKKFAAKMIGSKKKGGYKEVGGGATKDSSTPAGDGTLYVFGEAVTPYELEQRRDDWDTMEVMDTCREDIKHGVMKDAPAASKAVAEELHKSMPGLEDIAIVPGSEGSDGGEVIIISCSKKDAKAMCLEGLKFTKEFHKEYAKNAAVEKADFKKLTSYGFNLANKPGFSPMSDAEKKEHVADCDEAKELMKGTKIMAEKLTDHFVFCIKGGDITVSPFIFGGFASDGHIVGVLSSCVTT